MVDSFSEAVRRVVLGIPKGTTLAYGEVALLAGRPGAARAVVRALHALEDIPWWRVVRADKTLAPEIAARQAKLLRAEGVTVRGRRILPSAPHAAKRSSPVRSGP